MALTLEQVNHIAHLARLELTFEEKLLYLDQLSAILDYAARLQELDTTGIPPTSNVVMEQSNLRPDIPRPGMPPSVLLSNSNDFEADQFRVPPILD
jgi:aspartyl-tRNA(Asn)/glutamyl-tRNA(Gln) amidotransferase subunit C